MPEPSRIAGVIPTKRLSASAMSHNQSPNTCVNVFFTEAAGVIPFAGSNLPGP